VVARLAANLWACAARRADKCDLDVGFVVEGSADSELPEVLLGAARITKLNLKSAHELSKAEAKGKKR